MYKALLTITIAAIGVSALALTSQTPSKNGIQDHSPSIARSGDLPEHIPYMFLFQQLSDLQKRASEHRRLGKDGAGFQRRFKNVLVVDDDQFEKINEVALQTESEVEELDRKAKTITEGFWAQYPPGKVPEGITIPPPPAELAELQQMRSLAVLRGRDHIRAFLGDQEFARLDEIVKARLTPGIERFTGQ